jgi:predicted transcriptional regulator
VAQAAYRGESRRASTSNESQRWGEPVDARRWAAIGPIECERMDDGAVSDNFIELTAEIVSAYVSNNTVPASDISNLINQVHGALVRVSSGQIEAQPEALKPAVSVKKSVTPEYIVCLEDGKKFKSLKRHLRTQYNLTPEQYRDKWALPPDYPMVAPNYAAARSQLAKQMGLGQQRRRRK